MDVEPSALSTVELPLPEGRGAPVHTGEAVAALPLAVPAAVPAAVLALVPPKAAAADEEEAEDKAVAVAEEGAAIVAEEIRTPWAIVSGTAPTAGLPAFSLI